MPLADIRPALRAYLLADATISAAVGGTRIYPTVMPQGVKATSAVYNVISEISDHHTQGPSGLVMVRMQVDAYALTTDAADALARAVKGSLSRDQRSGAAARSKTATQKGTTT